jgi:D-3-phosphoglycerate dehydrogenase
VASELNRLRVLCAGDAFITPATLAAAARVLGDVDIVEHASRWPDEPFRAVDGVREAAGDPTALAAAAAGVDVLLTHLAPVTQAVLEAAGPSLKVVGITRGGPVNVDLAAATSRGIPVAYLPGRNLGAVAEFCVGVMITLTRNISPASRSLAWGTWDGSYFRYEKNGPELRAATVGLVGLGAVGLRVAELLKAFGARVLAYDPYVDAGRAFAASVELTDLPTLLAASDIVSAHARLTDDTRGMFDGTLFEAMKPGAYFVNTARGELVDEAALLAALESGRLRGAALDVFSPEPPVAGNPLVSRPDVIGTPHLAGASRQVSEESADKIAAAVAGYLASGVLEHCANPETL